MHREMLRGQDGRKERPRIRARARTGKNQRQRLAEVHAAVGLGEKRERQKEERHREAETQRGSPRDDRKYGETGHSGAGRHRQTEGQAQKDRDGNIED